MLGTSVFSNCAETTKPVPVFACLSSTESFFSSDWAALEQAAYWWKLLSTSFVNMYLLLISSLWNTDLEQKGMCAGKEKDSA